MARKLPLGTRLDARFALVAATAVLVSCQAQDRWPVIDTQRWPGPMDAAVEPLPPGVEGLYPPGIEEVLVVRHADPVQVQPAQQPAAFPLAFYDKQRRMNAGSWVFCAPGGRAELIWPNGATILIFDRGTGVVGSPSRGEPSFIFREVDVARLHPRPGERFQLLGGAVLEADAGPFHIERRDNDVLRVRSQAQVPADITYREELFRLDPGQSIDLPLLDTSGRAPAPLVGAALLSGPGFEVQVQGDAEALAQDGGVLLVGRGEHEVRALGARVRVTPGERIFFTGLGPVPASGSSSDSDSRIGEPLPQPAIEPEGALPTGPP